MTRISSNQTKEGKLVNGFDYENQAWVINGKYVDCGHLKNQACNCYGRIHLGEEIK